jgi:hypothetical protein
MLTLSVIGAPSALDPLLALDECVTFSKGFDLDKMNVTSVQGEVALFSAAGCPESLGLETDAFENQFRNKVVLWFGGAEPESCFGDFFHPYTWYKRLIDVGATAVVAIIDAPGKTPGVWYPAFPRNRWAGSDLEGVPDNELIPFITCGFKTANHVGNTASLSSPQRFAEFVAARTLELDQRAALTKVAALNPGNASIAALANSADLFASIDITASRWGALFTSLTYNAFFHGFIALLFFFTCGLGVWFVAERMKHAPTKGQGASRFEGLTVSVVALLIEIVVSFVCGLFYAADGLWATESFISPMRTMMMGQLTIVSLGSSVLVGLTFSDLRQSSKQLRLIRLGFVARHRRILFVLAGLLIGAEVVGTVFRRRSYSVYVITNGVVFLIAMAITAWFAIEAHAFSNVLTEIATPSQDTILSTSQKQLRQVIEHTRFWGYAHSITLLFLFASAMFANVHPYLLWNVNWWPICWGFIATFRAGQSICKIMLCRLSPALDDGASSTKLQYPREATEAILGGVTYVGGKDTTDLTQLEKSDTFALVTPSV